MVVPDDSAGNNVGDASWVITRAKNMPNYMYIERAYSIPTSLSMRTRMFSSDYRR